MFKRGWEKVLRRSVQWARHDGWSTGAERRRKGCALRSHRVTVGVYVCVHGHVHAQIHVDVDVPLCLFPSVRVSCGFALPSLSPLNISLHLSTSIFFPLSSPPFPSLFLPLYLWSSVSPVPNFPCVSFHPSLLLCLSP